MAEIGQLTKTLIPRAAPRAGPTSEERLWLLFAVLIAASAAIWMWPFTVDDALISIRYARHLALGAGYRFDLGGRSTDGVTPLGWPFLLWPWAHAAPLVVLGRAKMLGLLAWLAAASAWGSAVGRSGAPRPAKGAALLGLGVCVPLATHAVSGMETGVAIFFATVAAVLHRRPGLAAVLAGLAASFRPEMLPWALVLSTLFALGVKPIRWLSVTSAALSALAPFLVCCGVRLLAFGNPAPLALAAKPSDFGHGFSYAVAAALVSVGPVMAFAPLAAAKERGPGRAIVSSGLVHLVAVTVAGGDWMPYARLVAPIVPSLLYAAVLLWPFSRAWFAVARALAALALGLRTLVIATPAARHIGSDREALVERVTPILAGRRRIASVDIGWLSAATEADILDLAGVTDPEVAALGGGHTSKRIDASFLLAERPDALLLYADASDLALDRWAEAFYPRVVEARLARSPLVAKHFTPVAFVPLGATGAGYYVLYRAPDSLNGP
jgi:hypothetical protein